MQFDNEITRKVAEAAAKIMANEAKEGTEPKTDKEKSLAALAHPKDKITHKDVLVGRGVLKKEEVDNEDFAKEVETQKEKNAGKVRNDIGVAKPFQAASVREPAVQPVRKEETEQIDELSKDTLKSYIDKSATRLVAGDKYKGMDRYNRVEGIKKATSKLVKKEETELDERSLTEPEMKKKEEYVKGMKKKLSGFKERYGSRGKSVMYATATKMAKED
jgi:hypothetical protein